MKLWLNVTITNCSQLVLETEIQHFFLFAEKINILMAPFCILIIFYTYAYLFPISPSSLRHDIAKPFHYDLDHPPRNVIEIYLFLLLCPVFFPQNIRPPKLRQKPVNRPSNAETWNNVRPSFALSPKSNIYTRNVVMRFTEKWEPKRKKSVDFILETGLIEDREKKREKSWKIARQVIFSLMGASSAFF